MRVSETKTIVILGMHRSATSLVARGIARDFPMGRTLIGPSDSQPEGHFEDETLVALNDRILDSAGGSWRSPPPEPRILAQHDRFRRSIQQLIEIRNRDSPIWGCKDPRLCLTIRLFAPYFRNPIFVSCFRAPSDVAASLNLRNGIRLADGIRLAQLYNRRLLRFLEEAGGVPSH